MTRIGWTAAAAVATTVAATTGTATAASVDVKIEPGALVLDDGSAAVTVRARCPAGLDVLEGIVTVNQGGQEGMGFFAVPCDGRMHRATADVAPFDFTFTAGRATSSALLLVIDPSTEETQQDQDSRRIRLR